jgi:hypothetical protein
VFTVAVIVVGATCVIVVLVMQHHVFTLIFSWYMLQLNSAHPPCTTAVNFLQSFIQVFTLAFLVLGATRAVMRADVLIDHPLHAAVICLSQSFIQVFTLAFVVVGATCAIMVPIMLYMLQLQQFGWNWIHACMFGAMIASTDAVAIVSIMKTSERCVGCSAICFHPGQQAGSSKFFQTPSLLLPHAVLVRHTAPANRGHTSAGGVCAHCIPLHAQLCAVVQLCSSVP